MNTIFVYCTCVNFNEAKLIAKEVLIKRLAACANLLPKMTSLYWWENSIEEAEEVVLIFKTREDLLEQLNKLVLSLHSYKTPCLISLPIVSGNPAYLNWIHAETSTSEKDY
ncbi:MAG: divalent-cation tolerance protein CutA [Bacteroidetes bacterium]|nr:divalent-cation tolerance protein CutA [Bacteroidota bacterium]